MSYTKNISRSKSTVHDTNDSTALHEIFDCDALIAKQLFFWDMKVEAC